MDDDQHDEGHDAAEGVGGGEVLQALLGVKAVQGGEDPEAAVASSSYFMVIRLLERIGDHVVNLAQWVVYKMSGELVDLNTKDTDEMTEL